MSTDSVLHGRTFDQQLQLTGTDIRTRDISPNLLIPGEIVFEPLGPGIRVTARDEQHRVLWGYVGAKETVKQVHCLVATYTTLQDQLASELVRHGLATTSSVDDPMAAAQDALNKLQQSMNKLKDMMAVKKVSEATIGRALIIAQIASDAARQIELDAGLLNTK